MLYSQHLGGGDMHITSLGLWLYKILSQKTGKGGSWRDDSAVKSIYCSSREPGFSFQDPHMEIHILWLLSSDILWHQACT